MRKTQFIELRFFVGIANSLIQIAFLMLTGININQLQNRFVGCTGIVYLIHRSSDKQILRRYIIGKRTRYARMSNKFGHFFAQSEHFG